MSRWRQCQMDIWMTKFAPGDEPLSEHVKTRLDTLTKETYKKFNIKSFNNLPSEASLYAPFVRVLMLSWDGLPFMKTRVDRSRAGDHRRGRVGRPRGSGYCEPYRRQEEEINYPRLRDLPCACRGDRSSPCSAGILLFFRSAGEISVA